MAGIVREVYFIFTQYSFRRIYFVVVFYFIFYCDFLVIT